MITKRVFYRTHSPINGDQARALTASLLDGVAPDQVAVIMNYNPGTTQTRTAFPPVHFFGGKDGFGLYGFGDEGVDAVTAIAPALHQRLPKNGAVVQYEERELNNSATLLPYSITYRVPRMVVQKAERHLALLNDPVKGKEHIERLFMSSLERQANAMGLDLPACDSIRVEFCGADRLLAAKPKRDTKLGLMCLVNARFRINLRLSGIWAVGYLLSKGYGHFNATHQLSGKWEVDNAVSK
jgi:hypothetical protein